MSTLTRKDIYHLFELLNEELRADDIEGELFLVGGAVMCLVYQARPSTQDIDALFRPAKKIRIAAARLATKMNIEVDWLNDAVKGFFSEQGKFDQFIELDHLRVMIAQPEYLLAMKCLSMRIGSEFHDEDDIRYLLRYLNIDTYDRAVEIITGFYPEQRFPQKTLYALQELLSAN